jgi:hypothetical protein
MESAARHHHSAHPTHYEGGSRQSFHHPRTSLGATHNRRSLGAAGHWLHLLTVAAPLVIGEVFKDADKRWKAMRAVGVGTAIASEAIWTYRISQDKKHDAEDRKALKDCEEHCGNSR